MCLVGLSHDSNAQIITTSDRQTLHFGSYILLTWHQFLKIVLISSTKYISHSPCSFLVRTLDLPFLQGISLGLITGECEPEVFVATGVTLFSRSFQWTEITLTRTHTCTTYHFFPHLSFPPAVGSFSQYLEFWNHFAITWSLQDSSNRSEPKYPLLEKLVLSNPIPHPSHSPAHHLFYISFYNVYLFLPTFITCLLHWNVCSMRARIRSLMFNLTPSCRTQQLHKLLNG